MKKIFAIAVIALLIGGCKKPPLDIHPQGSIYTDTAQLNWLANDTMAVTTCHNGILYFPNPGALGVHSVMYIRFYLSPNLIDTVGELNTYACH